MTSYSYQATDSSGNTQEGTVEAHSLQAARDAVIALGLEPVEIYEPATTAVRTPDAPWVDPMQSLDVEKDPEPQISTQAALTYFPLLETLRLYAGWLLAWYSIVYAFGAYQSLKDIPYRIPYAESLFLSPLVLSFTFAAYLFLLLSGVYTMTGRSKKIGIVLTVIGVGVFLLYKMNVQ
jgi:hypothetical protein